MKNAKLYRYYFQDGFALLYGAMSEAQIKGYTKRHGKMTAKVPL